MDLELSGRVALVTGALRGIRLATVRMLAAEGCRVGLVARGEEDLRLAEEELRAGRAGTPEEVAAVITFLASPRASYCVNGANWRVDSGGVLAIT